VDATYVNHDRADGASIAAVAAVVPTKGVRRAPFEPIVYLARSSLAAASSWSILENMSLKDFTDDDLISYCEEHCKFDLGLFAGAHIRRMIVLAGRSADGIAIADDQVYRTEQMADLCVDARRRQREANEGRGVIASLASNKARGAYYTPPEIGAFLASWAVRTREDRVLDPACGDGALLVAAARRLRALGGGGELSGSDVHAPAVAEARARLAIEGAPVGCLRVADAFDEPPAPVDVVIGNPPFIRYQAWSGEARQKAQRAALAAGVELTGLANAWAAFVIHACRFLDEGGRLALVLPASLLSADYAAPVRRYLLKRFGSVQLVLFEARVFPGVTEEVVLLLAEWRGGTGAIEVTEARDLSDLPAAARAGWTRNAVSGADRWTAALLGVEAAAAYAAVTTGADCASLGTYGEVNLGAVTGNNDYFTLTDETAARWDLTPGRDLVPVSPPGSRHLRGLAHTTAAHADLTRSGSRTHLFYPAGDRPSLAAARYVAAGERDDVPLAHKCRIRSPWWRVPGVRVPDLFLTYMNGDTPRLVANQAGVTCLNSIHGVTLTPQGRAARDLLPIAALNSVTMLGAELVGRAYGGGILKLEPREAARLPLSSPRRLSAAAARLREIAAVATGDLRHAALDAVVSAVDGAVWDERLTETEIVAIREARRKLAARRAQRSRDAGP
jgi:adenine-specific DNA methylase